MSLWPLQVASGSDGLKRALAGLVLLAGCYLLRSVAVLVYVAHSSEMLRFPPKRQLQPRLRRHPGTGPRRPAHPVTPARKVAMWATIALAAIAVTTTMAAAMLAAAAIGLLLVGAAGWFLGPVVTVLLWTLLLAVGVVLPVTRSPDRAAAWGRLYRSARTQLSQPAMAGTTIMVMLPSPLMPLVRWADREVMRRVDVTSGPAPWVEQASRRTRRAAARP